MCASGIFLQVILFLKVCNAERWVVAWRKEEMLAALLEVCEGLIMKRNSFYIRNHVWDNDAF
jgi:hypothetical protein